MQFNKRNRVLLLIILIILAVKSFAVEGMYTPLQIKQLANGDMRNLGLQLSSDEIYDVSKASVKDAIVMLNGGMCSAEIISDQGLVLTNHHCAYSAIQSHSSVESDYLVDGFWAQSKEKELSNDGMTASIVVRVEDVTERILTRVDTLELGFKRDSLIKLEIDSIVKQAIDSSDYNAEVKTFYFGSEYHLFVYETFKDVRLVGAPPSSIGKFGGDTDNWMWTRHTGDFAMLRIYTDSAGKPAEYSESNIPYKPKHYLPISTAPKKENDFAMIMGFPGTTERYLPSQGVKMFVDKKHPEHIKVRSKKLTIIDDHIDDDKVRIQYASKRARISNYWKYFIGQRKGLKQLDVLGDKLKQEQEFAEWINQDSTRKEKYGEALSLIDDAYSALDSTVLSNVYINESLFGVELFRFAFYYATKSHDKVSYRKKIDQYYKDYDVETDQEMLASMVEMYISGVPREQLSPYLLKIEKKYKGNYSAYAKKTMKKSFFSSKERMLSFLENPNKKRYMNDPAYKGFFGVFNHYKQYINPVREEAVSSLKRGQRLFVEGTRQMKGDKLFYPDANSTLRLTYGSVLPYSPGDAKFYDFQTYGKGILEKRDPDNLDFLVPDRLTELLNKKDFGPYAENGKLPVNFLTDNDITGGNSGSGVINAKGELIGIAFDGNWEAMSGDVAFSHKLQRTISVDIRYVLFIIDKFAGATHLIDEMEIRP